MKRTVTIAEQMDDKVQYRQVNDCYVCPYDTGDKFREHECSLTGEYLHPFGRVDIDVPETCPFPAIAIGDGSDLESGIIGRYPGITQDRLSEITQFIEQGSGPKVESR